MIKRLLSWLWMLSSFSWPVAAAVALYEVYGCVGSAAPAFLPFATAADLGIGFILKEESCSLLFVALP